MAPARKPRRPPSGSRKPGRRQSGVSAPHAQRGITRDGGSSAPGQVGKRPSSPRFLGLVALVWIGCGIGALVILHSSWKIVVGIAFIGVGLFYLRGAAMTVLRHEVRRD